ncbi:MAG TPA: sel1 repeat family protein, partial [Burkholderiaceae bacterium]
MLRIVLICLGAVVALSAGAATQPAAEEQTELDAGLAAYVQHDYADALKHFRAAAERNQRVAQFNLAVMLV